MAGKSTRGIGVDVLTAARSRVSQVFDWFERIYLSGPSGKDSGVMMHLVCQEARRRGRKVGVLYVDLEAQYKMTIQNVNEMFELYADVIEPYWVAVPLNLRNAVSMEHPYWCCWDPEKRSEWVREQPDKAITDWSVFPFFKEPFTQSDGVRVAMEFEEFVEAFGHWYAGGKSTACFVGIRTDESLNRWRAIVKKRRSRLYDKPWTAWKGKSLFNAYPIYDWKTDDVWTYYGKENLIYNQLYDSMYRAGLSIHQQRICQPYGDDQRRGLGMYHVVEPESWAKVVARVAGANAGALYAGKHGNIMGLGKVTLPADHTWESFSRFLLKTLPDFEREHYEFKIATFIRWWRVKGVEVIPDHPNDNPELSANSRKGGPSWYRIAKCILKNDRMCRSLSFSQHKSGNYSSYQRLMRRRMKDEGWEWRS